MSWVSIPCMLLVPWASHKAGLVKPFIWGAALGFIVAAWAGIYIPVPLGWPLMVFLGVLCSIFPLILAFPVELVPEEWVGTASGMVLSIGYMGALVGPSLVGYFLDVAGTLNPGLVALMGAGIGLGVIGALLPETGSQAKTMKSNGVRLE
jgi:cyanate permease